MNGIAERAAAAAGRILEAHTKQSQCKLIEIELGAWLVGKAGGQSPRLANPVDDLHARLAVTLGSNDLEATESLLNSYLSTSEGEKLLFHACHLGGLFMADRLIEIAHRYPNKWFNGRMLATTSLPARLLALFDNQPTLGHAIITIGELVILGRDAGTPIAAAEERWAAVVRDELSHLHDPRFRDTWLRITVRESLDSAVDLLMRLADGWGRDTIVDGVSAVLARLVRQDPGRAAAVVTSSKDFWDQLAWFEALTWWFELPTPAEPILENLLNLNDSEINLVLARVLTSAQSPKWLDLALETVEVHPPLERARKLAPGISQLREAGLHEEAERIRDRVLPFLPENPELPGGINPRDLFETLSALGLPPLVPWGTGSGLP